MDIDKQKIKALQKGVIPIYEPGLEEMVKKNTHEGRLEFTTSLKRAVHNSDVIFLCLPTPQSNDGSADLSRVLQVAEQIARLVNGEKLIVSKSTVPVGTVDKIRQIVKRKAKHPVEVAFNPEFLKEGTALQDSLKPDRVVIGSRSKKAIEVLTELFEPFVRTGNPVLIMDERSAEMTKYAANAFLATKISFMNELANLCETVGADIDLVRRGIAADPRIGKLFLFPGVGYGGSCLPKDVKALVSTAEQHGTPLRILRAVDEVNEIQKTIILKKLASHFHNRLKGKAVGVWGLSFKPQTDDVREAPSLAIISRLLEMGVKVKAHDPIAISPVKALFDRRVKFYEAAYDAVKDVDALVVVTEWNEFRRPDFGRMKKLMKHPVIFDGRNIYDPDELKGMGFRYYGIGR